MNSLDYFRKYPIKIVTLLIFGIVFAFFGFCISFLFYNYHYEGVFFGLFAMAFYFIRRPMMEVDREAKQ